MDDKASVMAYRILRKLQGYCVAVDKSICIPEDILLPGDDIIGVYSNSDSNGEIFIGKQGLYYKDKYYIIIKYENIKKVEIEEKANKHEVDTLIFYMSDNSVKFVCIDGGDNKFRDIYQFIRFIERIISS